MKAKGRIKHFATLVSLLIVISCSSFEGEKLSEDGAISETNEFSAGVGTVSTGIPFTMTAPEYVLASGPDANDATKTAYSLSVNYVPDPSQTYSLRVNPAIFSDTNFNMTLGSEGELSTISNQSTEKITSTFTAIGSLALAATTLGQSGGATPQAFDGVTKNGDSNGSKLPQGADTLTTKERETLKPTDEEKEGIQSSIPERIDRSAKALLKVGETIVYKVITNLEISGTSEEIRTRFKDLMKKCVVKETNMDNEPKSDMELIVENLKPYLFENAIITNTELTKAEKKKKLQELERNFLKEFYYSRIQEKGCLLLVYFRIQYVDTVYLNEKRTISKIDYDDARKQIIKTFEELSGSNTAKDIGGFFKTRCKKSDEADIVVAKENLAAAMANADAISGTAPDVAKAAIKIAKDATEAKDVKGAKDQGADTKTAANAKANAANAKVVTNYADAIDANAMAITANAMAAVANTKAVAAYADCLTEIPEIVDNLDVLIASLGDKRDELTEDYITEAKNEFKTCDKNDVACQEALTPLETLAKEDTKNLVVARKMLSGIGEKYIKEKPNPKTQKALADFIDMPFSQWKARRISDLDRQIAKEKFAEETTGVDASQNIRSLEEEIRKLTDMTTVNARLMKVETYLDYPPIPFYPVDNKKDSKPPFIGTSPSPTQPDLRLSPYEEYGRINTEAERLKTAISTAKSAALQTLSAAPGQNSAVKSEEKTITRVTKDELKILNAGGKIIRKGKLERPKFVVFLKPLDRKPTNGGTE